MEFRKKENETKTEVTEKDKTRDYDEKVEQESARE